MKFMWNLIFMMEQVLRKKRIINIHLFIFQTPLAVKV